MPVDGAHSPHFNTSPFTLGTTEPNAANTGYGQLGYTAGTLTDDNTAAGPNYIYLVSVDNTVVQGLRIHGRVQITANNCTVQGCEIVGHTGIAYDTTANYGLVSSSGTGNVVQYNHITQYDPSLSSDNSIWWMVGVILTGGSCTVYRNDIHDVNDATYITGGTQTIAGNYIHDLGFRNDDSDQSGSTPPSWSHNDGTQVMGGTNHVIDGNSYVMNWSRQTGMNNTVGNPDPYAEQAWPNCHGVLMQNANNTLTGVKITRNWFKYGTVGPFFTFKAGDSSGAAHTLTGNRITPNQGVQFSQYRQIVVDPTTAWGTITVDDSNVYSHDPDTPAAVQGLPLNGNPGGNPFTVSTVKAWQYNSGAHTP